MLIESKNLIFRGAPGTGKSYLAKEIAADIISDGYFDDYTLLSDEQKRQVEFVQFHPSYDYSDFVEGLRPRINDDGTMGFELQDGIFKKFVARARKNYEDSQKSRETIEKELSVQESFRFQKIIGHNIAHLYPIRTNEEVYQLQGSVFDSTSIIPLKNVADVSQNGNFNRIITNPNMFYMAFPWLYNARTDDFIEICDKYPSEFDCLANTIERIAQASNGKTDLYDDVLIDLKEALINIQISFEKKKSTLKAKGITAMVGLALTCIPFAVPHFFNDYDPALLKTILGSASIIGSGDLLNDFFP